MGNLNFTTQESIIIQQLIPQKSSASIMMILYQKQNLVLHKV